MTKYFFGRNKCGAAWVNQPKTIGGFEPDKQHNIWPADTKDEKLLECFSDIAIAEIPEMQTTPGMLLAAIEELGILDDDLICIGACGEAGLDHSDRNLRAVLRLRVKSTKKDIPDKIVILARRSSD